jgi:poly-gamma-glutamate synthesis protein (capsule biosynthesis protein)
VEEKNLLIGAVGDVFINRPDGANAFTYVMDLLTAPDILFANSEGVYTDRTTVAPSSGIPVVSALANAEHLRPAGFDVLSMANNHTVDAGHEGLADSLDALRAQGAVVVGAGMNIAEARAPGIVAARGKKVAFLAYSCIYRPGYEARRIVPGVSPLRVHTQYYYPDWDPVGILEPGSRPHVRTFCYPEDVAVLKAAVAEAKQAADCVVVSLHVGDSTRPAFLHDYEHAYPQAAIDAGADIVLSHHHHFLRGCGVYRDKPIYYGLGHFTFDLGDLEVRLGAKLIGEMKTMGEYAIFPREGYPLLPFHPECRMTVIAYCMITGGRVITSCLVPCVINPENQPIPHSLDSAEGRRVADYIVGISGSAKLPTRFSFEGPVIAGFRTLAFTAG